MSYIDVVAARWTKSLKFTPSIAVHRGGLAKNHFWLVATQKKRIGEQLNDFWNMCPKPFPWAKNKRKMFSDGKSRGPHLARVAIKHSKSSPGVTLIIGQCKGAVWASCFLTVNIIRTCYCMESFPTVMFLLINTFNHCVFFSSYFATIFMNW